MNFYIKKITKENASANIKLLNRVFYNQDLYDKVLVYFVSKYNKSFFTQILLKIFSYKSIEFWGAFEKEKNELLGVVGAYSLKNDENYYFWLRWFCVDNKFRNKKIGVKLLDFIEKEAKNRGKTSIKLYTCDIPDRQIALKLYDKRNYKITFVEENKNCKVIYRQLDL
jgi:GNAT superfamily N-acetyltransferase